MNTKMKSLFYLLVGILIGTLIPITSAIANSPIKLIINNQQVQCDPAPQVINNRVFVPIRVVSETLGADVEWDGKNNTVVINSAKPQINQSMNNQINNKVETLKDYYIQGDVPCIKYNGIVYTPLLAGMNYYKISTNDSDMIYNQSNKSITFPKFNKTYIAGKIENNDDVIYYQSRIYIKESILQTMSN